MKKQNVFLLISVIAGCKAPPPPPPPMPKPGELKFTTPTHAASEPSGSTAATKAVVGTTPSAAAAAAAKTEPVKKSELEIQVEEAMKKVPFEARHAANTLYKAEYNPAYEQELRALSKGADEEVIAVVEKAINIAKGGPNRKWSDAIKAVQQEQLDADIKGLGIQKPVFEKIKAAANAAAVEVANKAKLKFLNDHVAKYGETVSSKGFKPAAIAGATFVAPTGDQLMGKLGGLKSSAKPKSLSEMSRKALKQYFVDQAATAGYDDEEDKERYAEYEAARYVFNPENAKSSAHQEMSANLILMSQLRKMLTKYSNVRDYVDAE